MGNMTRQLYDTCFERFSILHFNRSEFSPPKDGQHVCNELDKLTANFRKETLKSLKKSAKSLRENATDLDEALSEVDNLLQILKNTAIEVQLFNDVLKLLLSLL